jgi:hypothetical protein
VAGCVSHESLRVLGVGTKVIVPRFSNPWNLGGPRQGVADCSWAMIPNEAEGWLLTVTFG